MVSCVRELLSNLNNPEKAGIGESSEWVSISFVCACGPGVRPRAFIFFMVGRGENVPFLFYDLVVDGPAASVNIW